MPGCVETALEHSDVRRAPGCTGRGRRIAADDVPALTGLHVQIRALEPQRLLGAVDHDALATREIGAGAGHANPTAATALKHIAA